ncbi:tetraspanin-33-like [Symsagittifera roscoffensis]|uniref:tetraspanin-33-like n=1 Tax=Symsagittifera roscoffensis TaxID=84072 RepID=UPI00307BC970
MTKPDEVQETPISGKEAPQVESFLGMGTDEPDFYIDVQTHTKYHECYCCHVPELAHNVIKFVLFLFNVLFWVISFVLVVIGIWALTVNADYGNALSGVMTPSVMLIALGVIIFLVSFSGCVGALRENTYLLKAFIAIMGCGIILQLIFVIVVFTLNGRMRTSLDNFFQKSTKNYNDDVDIKNILDYIQHELQCCGGEGPNDWELNMYYSCDSIAVSKCGVPFSCCRGFGEVHNNTQCGFGVRAGSEEDTINTALSDRIFTGGCTNRIIVYINENLSTVAIVLLLFFLPQLMSMFLAVTFMGQVEDEIEYWKQREDMEKRGYYFRT